MAVNCLVVSSEIRVVTFTVDPGETTSEVYEVPAGLVSIVGYAESSTGGLWSMEARVGGQWLPIELPARVTQLAADEVAGPFTVPVYLRELRVVCGSATHVEVVLEVR